MLDRANADQLPPYETAPVSAATTVADVAAALADVPVCWRCLCEGIDISAAELDASIVELRRTLQIVDILAVCEGCGRWTLLYRLS